MLLITSDRTWTLRLCSMYFLHISIFVKSLTDDKTKEPLVVNGKIFQKNYRFEDFFWSGSGDSPILEDILNGTEQNGEIASDSFDSWRTTTVFHTTTILFATIYPNSNGCFERDCIPEVSISQTESNDFSIPLLPSSHIPKIRPTPTLSFPRATTSKLPDLSFHTKGTDTGAKTLGTPILTTPKLIDTNQFSHSSTSSRERDHLGNDVEEGDMSTVFPETFLDQKYWLLTILRNDNYLPNIDVNSTEMKLSSLHRQAFNRRQEKYLGGNDFRDRKERKVSQSIKAHIVNVTQIGNDIGIIYSVTLAGKPIPATTAANDMRLMTAREVIAELGRPILTKAEPFIKAVAPFGARVKGKARDTWLLIGSVVAAVFLLMLLAGLFALILSKKQKRKSSGRALDNQRQVFEENGGTNNLAFDEDADLKQRNHSKLENSNETNESAAAAVKSTENERSGSFTSSSCSGLSDTGLVRFRCEEMRRDRGEDDEEKPRPKPRTRERRIKSSDWSNGDKRRTCVMSAGSIMSRNTVGGSATEDYSSHLTRSPTSYLSMPSVKAFPRGTKIPEPLNKVLEPTVIRHLDADSDSPRDSVRHVKNLYLKEDVEHICEAKNKFIKGKAMTRHASLEGDDPGFIGPVVWNRHCQKITERETDLLNEEEYENINVGRMRKRFNDLLDDALSMFGSRNGSPEGSDICPARQSDHRIHSAVVRPAGTTLDGRASCRPNTTGSNRPQSSVISSPKGAWETPNSSTLGRPLSAGIYLNTSPSVDKNLINVDSELMPGDPAIPLIAAIKHELKRFDDPSCSKP